MLQRLYPAPTRKGSLKNQSTTPQSTKNIEVLKTPSRLLLVRPSYLSIIKNGLKASLSQLKLTKEELEEKVFQEHHNIYETLYNKDFYVTYIDNKDSTIDSMFCNRFVSVHHPIETGASNTYGIIYPVYNSHSMKESIEQSILLYIQQQYKEFIYYDLRFDNDWAYLEGLDSIVIDRYTKTVYAFLSSKTYYWKLLPFKHKLGYNIYLIGYSGKDERIPYTSFVMSIGRTWAVICSDVLDDYYKKTTIENLQKTKTVIDITSEQLQNYCGNIIEITNKHGETYTLMSSRSYSYFTEEQKAVFKNIIHIPLDIIEKYGHGIRRCIMEI